MDLVVDRWMISKTIVSFLSLYFLIGYQLASASNTCASLFTANPQVNGTTLASRPASERLANATPSTKRFWRIYERQFNLGNTAYYNKRLELYLSAKQSGHPYIKFLESIGFRFEPKGVKVPTLAAISNHLETRLNDLIESGQISKDLALFPVIQVSYENGSAHKSDHFMLKYGENVPENTIPSTRRKVAPLLDEEGEFRQRINNGVFVLSTLGSVNGEFRGDGINGFQHDLSHFYGFFKAPAYMMSLRRAMKEPIAEKPNKVLEFFAFESAYLIKKSTDAELATWMGLPLNIVKNKEYSEIKKHYESLNEEEISILKAKIVSNYYEFVIPLGGGTSDMISPFEISSFRQYPVQQVIMPLIYEPQQVPVFRMMKPKYQENFPANSVEALTNLAEIVIASRDIKPEDWGALLTPEKNKVPDVFIEAREDLQESLKKESHPLQMLLKHLDEPQ